MAVPPYIILLSTLPVTAALTVLLAKKRPDYSRRRVITLGALPATLFALVYLTAMGIFSGSPDDWEGLTYALAPLMAAFSLGFMQLLGMATAALVIRRLRPKRGYIE